MESVPIRSRSLSDFADITQCVILAQRCNLDYEELSEMSVKFVECDREQASQEKRLDWFISNSATFAELVDVCGIYVLPVLYWHGRGTPVR